MSLIERKISKFPSKVFENKTTADPTPSNKIVYVSLPYFGEQSEELKNELTNLYKKYFKEVAIKIMLSNTLKIRIFFL